MPAGPVIDTRRALGSRPVRVQLLLEQPELFLAADERRLDRLGPTGAASLRDHAQRLPRWHGRLLALQHVVTGGLESDRRAGRAHRGLAHQHAASRGDRLQAGSRVDQVASEEVLVGGTHVHRGFAGQDSRTSLDLGTQAAYRVGQLERCSDRAFGVVLMRRRCAPHRHDGVADELLDRAAVARDNFAGDRAVSLERVSDFLGVAFFGEWREPDEIRKEDGHEAAFRALALRRDVGVASIGSASQDA